MAAAPRIRVVVPTYNNARFAYSMDFEAGGTKFVKSDGLVARGNFVHHNGGPGLWSDIDNIRTLYEGNRVEDNAREGIVHEISYSAVIRGNTVLRNGLRVPVSKTFRDQVKQVGWLG